MALRTDTLNLYHPSSAPRELSRWAALNLGQLPFQTVLSLEPLIAFCRSAATQPGMAGMRLFAAQVEDALREAPALTGPITDPSILDAHRDQLDLLMSVVFPPALRDREVGAALVPLEYRTIYRTPSFARYLSDDNGVVSGRVNLDLKTFTYGKVLVAYLHLLRTVYDIEIPFDFPILFTVADPETGLDRYFDITLDLRFVRVEPLRPIPPLDDEQRRALLDNLSDLSRWQDLFPPESFRFSGFTILHADDVTEHRVLSLLDNELADTEHVLSGQSFPLIAERLRTLLRAPRIEVGLAILEGRQLLLLNEPRPAAARVNPPSTRRYEVAQLADSLVARCIHERQVLIIDDLAATSNGTPFEEHLRVAGVRNLVLAPLMVQDEVAGILFLWSREPDTLHALNVLRIQETLPLFASAVRRGLEAMRNRVRNVIMGEYTSIHPAVEWRFRQAALNYLQRQERGLSGEVEPIVFQDVYPLFAATDIRASSGHRNEAMRHDLHAHLDLAGAVLGAASEIQPMPVLSHLSARIKRYQAALRQGFSSGDEIAIRDFLHNDVDLLLNHLRTLDPQLARRVDRYLSCVDPDYGVTYRQCRAFENSVREINRTISTYLDAEEAKMQAALPHYFETHQTDGVAFGIYAGASLLEHGTFDPIHVRMLRLWQLIVVCGIARRVEPLKASLEVPLETTHLVLVQTTPVTIRFRFDESRFDVDGTQHIRYEIMKQRVEKANVMNRNERLTQPERIAIVYSQDREGEEYARYIDHLRRHGLLVDPVEDLALEDLQGMTGLRAFRVRVALDAPTQLTEVSPKALEETIRKRLRWR